MHPSATPSASSREERSALIAGFAAFGTWGLIPIYWKLLKTVSAPEILAHRCVWTTLFLVLLLTWQRRWPELRDAARSRRTLLYCLASGLALSTNWLFFIWAVNVGRVIETSLGYFMTPLVNVLFGAIFLRERLTRWQLVSVLLALAGVLNLTLGYGKFPWVAVALCFSFGLYGLLRKKSGTRAIPGLFLETTLLTSARPDLFASSATRRCIGLRPIELVARAYSGQHRYRDRPASRLVRTRRAASAHDDHRFPPIPRAERKFSAGRLSLSRTVHPQSSDHLQPHLGRACHLYRRGAPPMAFLATAAVTER